MKKIIVMMIVTTCLIQCKRQSSHNKTVTVSDKKHGQVKSTNEAEANIFYLPFALYKPMPP